MDILRYTERCLLGTLMSEPARVNSIAGWLWPEDFSLLGHGWIFRELRDMVADARTGHPPTAPVYALHTRSNPIAVIAAQRHAFTDEDVARHSAHHGHTPDWYGQARALVPDDTPDEHLPDAAEQALRGQWVDLTADPAQLVVTLFTRLQANPEPGVNKIQAADLHAMIADAPPPQRAQPERYAQSVLECSIRRTVRTQGLRIEHDLVAQGETGSGNLVTLTETVDGALAAINTAARRWETRPTGDRRPALRSVDRAEPADTDPVPPATSGGTHAEQPDEQQPAESPLELVSVPSDQERQQAEETVVGSVLLRATTIDQLQVRPSHFHDRDLRHIFTTASEVHATPHEDVDVLTVAWQLQRQQHQPAPATGEDAAGHAGIDVTRLQTAMQHAAQTPAVAHAEDVMQRAALARAIQGAAQSVQMAADRPGMSVDTLTEAARAPLVNVAHVAHTFLQTPAQPQQGPDPAAPPTERDLAELTGRARHLQTISAAPAPPRHGHQQDEGAQVEDTASAPCEPTAAADNSPDV